MEPDSTTQDLEAYEEYGKFIVNEPLSDDVDPNPSLDNNTALKYATFPQPIVAYLKMMMDLKHHLNNTRDIFWILPSTIRPTNKNFNQPSPHLLGYFPAEDLTVEQVAAYGQCGVDGQTFTGTNVNNIPLLYEVISFVSGQIEAALPDCWLDTFPENENGSAAQLPLSIWCKPGPNVSNLDIPVILKTPILNLPPQAIRHAYVYRYRLRRRHLNPINNSITAPGLIYFWEKDKIPNTELQKWFHSQLYSDLSPQDPPTDELPVPNENINRIHELRALRIRQLFEILDKKGNQP